MDITELSIKNFLTIGEAEIALDSRGLLLIQGQNDDDSSAKSNGAGKSSIVDALCWCLFGETARGVTGDAVVNDTAKKDCAVSVTLDDDGVCYLVSRYRKHKVNKNQLMVWQIPAAGSPIDLAKGTDKETQEVVLKILGCSLDVFKGAVYAGQEAMPDLPGMTDKNLKLLIEEAAGVEVLAEAYKEASTRSLVVEREFTVAQTALTSLQARHGSLNAELVIMTADMDIFEAGRKDKARLELAKIKPMQDEIDLLKGRIIAFDEPALIAEQKKLEASLADHAAQAGELKKLTDAERAAADHVNIGRTGTLLKKDIHDKRTKALADIESQIGKPCGECGKAYCAHDLEAAKVMQQKQVEAIKKEIVELATDVKTRIVTQATAAGAVEAFKATMTDVSVAMAEIGTILGTIGTIQSLRRRVEDFEANIVIVKAAAKRHLTDVNPWTKAVENKTADIGKTEADMATKTVECLALEEKKDIYASAAKVFGPAGVRAHILDTVTPFLNERTGEYLGALADGNINATWSTLSKTAKGELKEKFNIEVVNDKGAKSFAGLSGGEKRKVRLAAAMALQDMVASRATKPINIFIADEVDHALDEAGLERLMGVLEKKAKERGTVLVISHNSLSDWIDNVITVTKTGGTSNVAGATVRGF